MELAKAYVQIIPSADGIKGGIEKAIDGESVSAGKKAGLNIVSKIKDTIKNQAKELGKALAQALYTEGAALEQSIDGIKTLFKDSTDTMMTYAQNAYKTAGISANSYMEQATGFAASLLQSLDGDTAKAAETTNMALMDMSDNANKFGTDMESIQYAYQGFAKQNYTMLDNLKLGYGGTKAEMERLLARAQEITGVKYDISNLDDVYNAIHVIQEDLGITGTTADEAAKTLSGSFGSMKAAFSNFLGYWTLGEDIKPHLQALIDTTIIFLRDNLIPAIWNVVKAIPEIIGEAFMMTASKIPGMTPVLETLSTVFGETMTALQTFWITYGQPVFDTLLGVGMTLYESFMTLWPSIQTLLAEVWSTIQVTWDTILRPVFDTLLVLLDEAYSVFEYVWPTVTEIVGDCFELLKQWYDEVLQPVIAAIGEFLETYLLPAFETVFAFIGDNVKNCFDFISDLWNNTLYPILEGIITFLSGIFTGDMSKIWEGIQSIIEGVWNGICDFVGGIVDTIAGTISDVFSGIWDTVSGIFGDLWDSAVEAWNGIKEAIMSPIESAKNFVGDMIEAMKEFFNFNWKLPKIKLPHFKVSGSANPIDWLSKGIPKISVEWYAKGGIMDNPTIFGLNGNNLMGGGEAGAEAIAPLTELEKYYKKWSSEVTNAQDEVADGLLQKIYDLLAAIAGKDFAFNINGREFALATAEDIDIVLDQIGRRKERR